MIAECNYCGDRNKPVLSPEAVADMAARIPIEASLRADTEIYERRLAICSGCDALREKVLCAYCGCFVLFRARPRKGYCPHPAGDRWADLLYGGYS